MLAPPVESHDAFTRGDIDSDGSDHLNDRPGERDVGKRLVVHALPATSFTSVAESAHGHSHGFNIDDFWGGNTTAIHPKHFEIEWIRVYKNPKTTPLADLWVEGDNFESGLALPLTLTSRVIVPPGFPNRRARVLPSLWKDYKQIVDKNVALDDVDDTYFWVDIDPTSGELIEDKSKPGNSGRVMPGQNDTVVPGDIVAIAINVKLRYYTAVREFVVPNLKNPEEFANAARTTGWSENDLPLWFKEGQKAPEPGDVWARNYGLGSPGPTADKPLGRIDEIAGGSIVAAVGIPHVGILNPNYPLERHIGSGVVNWTVTDFAASHRDWGHTGEDGYHTIVYQFTVTDEHLDLNLLPDGWLAGDGTTVSPFNVPHRNKGDKHYHEANFDTVNYPHGLTYQEITALRASTTNPDHDPEFGFAVSFGSNNYTAGKRLREFFDVSAFITGGPYSIFPEGSATAVDNDPGLTQADVDLNPTDNIKYTYAAGDGVTLKRTQYRSHRREFNAHEAARILTKDANAPNVTGLYGRGEPPYHGIRNIDLDRNSDGLIDYFPIVDIEADSTNANGRVRHYAVSDGFYEHHAETKFPHYFPPTYNTAKGRIYYPRVLEGYVAAMTEIDGPSGTQTGTFRVTLRFQEDYGDFQTAPAHGEDVVAALQAALAANVENGTVSGLSRRGVVDDARQYQVMLMPALGFKGELTLQLPAGAVVAVNSGLGNLASAAVTVQVDTSLQLVSGQEVEVVEPEGDAYQTGDEIEVRVPFETDGLTYEGENPPYVTIYLGAQDAANARHATWQKGAEQSGSTVVPFVYVLQEADPSAESVSVDLNSLSIPRETTLMSGAGLERRGTDDPAVDVGEVAPVPVSDPSTEPMISITDPDGERGGTVTVDPPAPVKPAAVIYLPPDDTVSKAVASPVPRSPIVFNELGNGSDATNDWLEFRNVSGSDVSLKDWELSVIADGKKEDTSLIIFPDVSVPANGLLLITNSASDKTPLAGGEKKGLSHASLVDAGLSLPDDGKFLLILRNAKEKLGLDEAFIDVAGGGGSDTDAFVRDETGDYDTHVWPLQVLESPGDATEDALSSGKVWQRAKADIIGYHRDAWAEAAFTGIGYDRQVSKSAATAGTPGYPNGAVKTEASTPKGAVTISEIMFDSEGGTLPQWIELYNKSKTEALNLNRWQLEIQNRNSGDLVGRPIVTLTLQEKVIQPNQTLLIVAGDARASSADVFPEDRVYNLLKLHEKNLRIKTARDTFLSGEGFYLKLSDRNGTKIDEVGNIDDNRRTDDAPVWVWPTNRRDGARSSVVRRYDKGAVARDGMFRNNWALAAHFNKFKVESLHYGHADDIGTPGYRQGGALPVELSSFTLTRSDAGPVVVTWTTESEVDNAGFNLRRSLKRDSGFTLLNPVLIAGAGTTGERQTYTFTDTSAKPGVEYYYQIEEVSLGGKPEVLRTRYLPGPVSPANRSLTTFGEVKQRE